MESRISGRSSVLQMPLKTTAARLTVLTMVAICVVHNPVDCFGILLSNKTSVWNSPGLNRLELPAEHAPWPPTGRAAREAWAEIDMLEQTRASDTSRLVGLLESSPDPIVRWRACRAFARLQDSTGMPELLEALRADREPGVRREAAFALG